MADIFNLNTSDLINLQRWYRRAPRQFNRAATNVINTLATRAKIQSIRNIESKTTTRAKSFVRNSLRVDKSPKGMGIGQIVAETYSFDISGQGRATGFEELESGGQYRGNRVPTLMSRGAAGKNQAKVSRGLRMDKTASFHKHKQFKSKRAKNKHQQVAAMISSVRAKKAANKAMVIPSGLNGKLGNMTPGIYKLKAKGLIRMVNPFKGSRGRTKRIAWMQDAIETVSSNQEMTGIWSREINKILSKR